ncbi:DNA sulfur modification protein DndB [Acinetobacter sp. P1(2025)]|uniref:DNA sulfur modification protein DndB n=1 Tax=Acinetobacter sp. P1(2025) TaxID=3446120 RepID=UPI003F53D518
MNPNEEPKFLKTFSAVRGVQGGRSNYLIQIRLSDVENLFSFNYGEKLDKSYQRPVNPKRKVQIADYMTSNSTFILPTVLAFPLRGSFTFESIDIPNAPIDLGVLKLSVDCILGLFDGQHRVSGIIEALKKKTHMNPNDTISVLLLEKQNLISAQQIFSDININAVKPSQSIKLLYDNRNMISVISKGLIRSNPFLSEYTDMTNSNLAKDSIKLFSFSAIYSAVNEMMKGLDDLNPQDKVQFINDFWSEITQHFIPFCYVSEKSVTPENLRQTSLAPFAVTIQALGIFAVTIFKADRDNWKEYVHALHKVSFLKQNPTWINRVIQNGKIRKSRTNSVLIANVLLKEIGIELQGDLLSAENNFLGIKKEVDYAA